jgi:hypothetical protein
VWNLTTGTATSAGSAGGSPAATIIPGSGDGFWAAPGDQIAVNAQEVANPSASGSVDLGISTAGDPVPVTVPYTVASKTGVGSPLLQLSSFAGNATGVTYAITFKAASGLVPDFSTITVAFPAGTGLPPGGGDDDGFSVYDDTTGRAGSADAQITGTTAVITPGTGDGFEAAPGDVITVLVTPSTNPPAGKVSLKLSTSTDPATKTISYTLS